MRTAGYVRVSTRRQSQAQTIDQQLARLQAHLAAQGEALQSKQIFRDDGDSGATLNRPGLDRLRDAVRGAEVDRVLITTPDRLARNYVHQMVLLEELERAGCAVEFLERPMSQAPHAQLVLQIRSAVAEYERTLIAERMRRGRQMKLRAGVLLPWTTTPYGYRVDPERPRDPAGGHIDPAEGAIVRELFMRHLEAHETLRGLVKDVPGLGLPSPRGRARWSAASVRGILTTPAYAGQVYSGRKRMRPAHQRRSATHPIGTLAQGRAPVAPEAWQLVATIPAMVSPEHFAQVRAKLALNQRQASRQNKTHASLLRALVSCGVCQACCIARTTNGGLRYYVCRTKAVPRYAQPGPPCRSRHIPAQQLEDLVWHDLCALMRHPEQIAHALERAHGGHWLPQELRARREALRKGRVTLETQIDRLTQAYLAEIIPLAEYQRRRRTLEEKIQALETQITQLEAQADRQAEWAGLLISTEAFCRRVQAGLHNATFQQRRQLIELLIDRVVVTDDEVEIRYVMPTHPRSEHVRFCQLRKDYFHHVVEVLRLPQRTGVGEVACLLEGFEGWGIRRVLINRDDPWGGCMLGLEGLTEKALGGLGIAGRTQQKVESMALRIDRPVEVIPLFLNFDVGLIDAVRISRRCEIGPAAFVKLGRVALDPAEHRRVIDVEAALQQEFFHVTVAQGIPEIPSHPTDNDLGSKVAPFE
jgi:site-specific DNA recombinase